MRIFSQTVVRVLAAGALLALAAGVAGADEAQAGRRVQLGTRIFPAIVAADQDLVRKRSPDGQLQAFVLYRDDADGAAEAASRLSETRKIKDIPLHFLLVPYSRLGEFANNPPAALFIAEWAPDELATVIRFGIDHHRLVFSPFDGDVAAGAQTGLFISDRIVPLVNLKAVKAAGIQLKPFFLEVAKTQ